MVIGAPGTSSGSFAQTNGWISVLQKETGAVVRIIPEDNDTIRYRRFVERKDFAFVTVSGAAMRFQVEGLDAYAATEPSSQRLLWHTNDTPWAFVVAGGSKIKSLEDIKKGGVRITSALFSPTMKTAVEKGIPAYLGLTPEETEELIEFVPAATYVENCRSVVEGKADIAYCATSSSVSAEIEAAPGSVRWLGMPASNKAGWEAFLDVRPMLIPAEIEIGVSSARGVESANSNYIYSVLPDADIDLVYNLAKWMHNSFDTYSGTHPLSARMSLGIFRSYLDKTPMPVHEGTIKYLREVGEWTEADDEWNSAAIKKMDSWVEARKAALAEAREKGVEVKFNNQAFLDILAQHTKDLEVFRSRL